MSKKEIRKLKDNFEFECYLRDDICYIMMKYGFYVGMAFSIINVIFCLVSIFVPYFIEQPLIQLCVCLVLLAIMFIGAFFFMVGNILFEILFKDNSKHIKANFKQFTNCS